MLYLCCGRIGSTGERFGGVRRGRDERVMKKLVSWKSTLLITIQTPTCIYSVIVQFGCYQHKLSSSPTYTRLSLEVTCTHWSRNLSKLFNVLLAFLGFWIHHFQFYPPLIELVYESEVNQLTRLKSLSELVVDVQEWREGS